MINYQRYDPLQMVSEVRGKRLARRYSYGRATGLVVT